MQQNKLPTGSIDVCSDSDADAMDLDVSHVRELHQPQIVSHWQSMLKDANNFVLEEAREEAEEEGHDFNSQAGGGSGANAEPQSRKDEAPEVAGNGPGPSVSSAAESGQAQGQGRKGQRIQGINFEELFPPGNSMHRRAIVEIALPHLYEILTDSTSRMKDPRALVTQCVERCIHTNLWGIGGTFSRKRSVIDSILMHFFHPLQEYLANPGHGR